MRRGHRASRLQHDSDGRLSSSKLDTGVAGTTTLGYDAIGRLTGLTHNTAGTAADVSFGFTYSPASQMLTHARDNDSYAWTAAIAATRNYAANGLNQYTQVVSSGTTPSTYDANGNLTSSTDASGSWTYLYDVENRLVKASSRRQPALPPSPICATIRWAGCMRSPAHQRRGSSPTGTNWSGNGT